jgi:hypothetical protein
VTMGQCGYFKAQEVIVIVRREREMRSSGLSSMVPLGGGQSSGGQMMAFNRDGWSSGGRHSSSGTSMVLVTGDGNVEGDQR